MGSGSNKLSGATTGGDRFLFAFFVVCIVHALAIFGIRFVAEGPAVISPPPSVEIIISPTSNELMPEEADFLGRQNSSGGDPEVNENVRRSDIFASFSTKQDLGVAPLDREQENAPSPSSFAPDVLTSHASELSIASQPEAEAEKQPVEVNSLVDKEALQIASLTQELRTRREQLSRQQRKLTLNANTREYIAAEYVNDWVRAVESVGNINLPPAARDLAGDVILEININSRGELLGIRVLRSSGHSSLDDAAQLSVKLASPFKAFSPKMSKKVDILNIVRTWSYANNRLTTQASRP